MTLEEIAGQIPLKTRAGHNFHSIPGVVAEEAVQWQYPYGSMGALLSPERTQEFDASFMYAAAQGTVMVMSRCPAEQYVPAQLVVA
jgi:hypothetical protein